jgi:hypothetical protein
LESISFLQFLNRQWHGKKESTVVVFRPGGCPSQAISTAEEKEERRSVSGLHETFKAKREKTTKERRTNERTNKHGFTPQTMRSQKNAQNRQKKKNDDEKTSQKNKQQKKTEKERARKIQTKRPRSCNDGLRGKKKTYYNSFIKTNNKTSTTTTKRH